MAYTFTDYNAVRALLGLSAKELPDSVLSQTSVTNQLLMDFLDIAPGILDDYEAAVLESTQSAQNFVLALDTYAPAAVASFILPGLPHFSPRSVTDGKAGFTRFADSPYKVTIDRVNQTRFSYRRRLKELYAIYLGAPLESAGGHTVFVVSSPTYDPVTG